MKLLIASDIHGSSYYCKRLMQAVETETPDKILLLGDLLYHGPRNDLPRDYAPKEVIGMLSGLNGRVLCVRGNCESEVDQMVLPFPILAEYAWLYIDGISVFATHGHHISPENPPRFDEPFVLLGGHTHVAGIKSCGGFIYANPGSVSIPKENTERGYLLLQNGSLILKNLDGKEIDVCKI